MKNKSIAITFIFIFVLLLLGILGFSYAYFQPILSSTGNNNLIVSKDLRLLFSDESISEGEIYPGESYSKKFTVTNNGANTSYYEIKWQDYNNSFTNDEIHIELKCVSYTNYFNGSKAVSGTCEGFSDKAVTSDPLKEAVEITSGKTHEYEVILTFIETGTNQDYNKGKVFNSTLDVVENVLLTVNLNGGTPGQTLKTAYEIGEVVNLSNPSKSGSVFFGWTASGRGTSLNGSNLTIGDTSATLTAGFLAFADMFTYYIGPPLYETIGTNGVDYLVIDDGSGNWRIKFLTSGRFTPLVAMNIDAFLVGGGTGGNVGGTGTTSNSGGGGGGGRTVTASSIALTANQECIISIGSGGGSSSAGQSTTGFGQTALSGTVNASKYKGNAGGSGGGGGAQGYTGAGAGGTNGGNGVAGNFAAGTGQGTTTREFGEVTGTLYAGGGGGGGGPYSTSPQGAAGGAGGGATGGARQGGKGANAAANTGGGGGGGGAKDGAAGGSGGTGGSGIVVIRNHR